MTTAQELRHPLEAGAREEGPSLGDTIYRLLVEDRNVTDVFCATGDVVRVRRASNDWSIAEEGGKPIQVDHRQIVALINGIYEREETVYLYERHADGNPVMVDGHRMKRRKPSWIDELEMRKSLNPSMSLAPRPEDPPERVRFTIQKQGMGERIAIMARGLREVPASMRDLGLPVQLERMIDMATKGLLIVTGPTGSGKSTTIASILQRFNQERRGNIVTLEDPVEFEYVNNRCFFNQREVGVDVESFEAGVRDAMRFAFDVLLIGEIRDAATMRAALHAASSAHLVLATLHAPTGVAAVRRMLAYLEGDADAIALSNSLLGVVAQALVPDQSGDGSKKHLAFEVLNGNEASVRKAVASADGKQLDAVEEALRKRSIEDGISVPFRESLARLVQGGSVAPEVAAAVLTNVDDRMELLKTPRGGRGAAPAVPPGGGAVPPGQRSAGLFRARA